MLSESRSFSAVLFTAAHLQRLEQCLQELAYKYLGGLKVESVASPVAWLVKNSPANSGDTADAGLIPGLGRSPGGGNGNSLQYSCLENSMDRRAWRATVHGVTKNNTQLSTHTQLNK